MICDGCEITLSNISERIGANPEDYLQFLQKHGVLKTTMSCPDCGKQCKASGAKLLFRCSKWRLIDQQKIKCNFFFSMKTNTWLKGKHLPLNKVCRFICMWLLLPHPRHELMMSELGTSSNTVVEWSVIVGKFV